MANNINELEKLMRGTKGIPIRYELGRERAQLRRIRRIGQDYDDVLRKIKQGETFGGVEITRSAILKGIKNLYGLGYRSHVSEMKLVDRANDVARLLIKYKVESKELERFVKVMRTIKALTRENWDLVNTALRREREALLQRLKAYGLMNFILGLKKTPGRLIMEIEFWRRKAAEQLLIQRRSLRDIKGLIDKLKKGEGIEKFDSSLKEFSDAVSKEMELMHRIIINFAMAYIDLRNKYSDLKIKKGFPDDKKINAEFSSVGKDISEISEIPAFKMTANIR